MLMHASQAEVCFTSMRRADGRASSLLDVSKGADLADFIERDTPEPSKHAPRGPAGGTLPDSQRWPQPQGPIYPGSSPAGTPIGSCLNRNSTLDKPMGAAERRRQQAALACFRPARLHQQPRGGGAERHRGRLP